MTARRLNPYLAACLLLPALAIPAISREVAATDASELETAIDRLGVEYLARRPLSELALAWPDEDAADDNAGQAIEEEAIIELPSGAESNDVDLAAPTLQLTPELEALRERVRQTLAIYYPQHLNTRDHNPWEVMHQIVAYGVKTQLRRGGPQGDPVNAISYIGWNGDCRGRRLLQLNGERINAAKGPSVQGHYGQLLAILAQSAVPGDYPLLANGKQFTIDDLVETEKLGCYSGTELTFKLIGIAHYCDLDVTWKNDRGEDWSIPKLLREEINAPVRRTVTCGGTHRMFAVAYPVRKLQRQGKPLTGEYLRAQIHTQNYQKYTLQLQNPDGSLSTEWYEGRGASPDLNRRLKTTGHLLEWLVFSLEDDQLDDPKVLKAVDYLSGILTDHRSNQWEIGPLGHGLHALAIFEDRITRLSDGYSTPEPQEPARELAEDTHRDAAASEAIAPPKASRVAPSGSVRTAQRPAPLELPAPTAPANRASEKPAEEAVELEGPALFAP